MIHGAVRRRILAARQRLCPDHLYCTFKNLPVPLISHYRASLCIELEKRAMIGWFGAPCVGRAAGTLAYFTVSQVSLL